VISGAAVRPNLGSQRWLVSKRVNSSKADSDDPKLIEPVKQEGEVNAHPLWQAVEAIGRKLRITDRMLDVLMPHPSLEYRGGKEAVFIGAKSFRRGQTAIGLGHRIVNRRMYPADTVAISDPLPTARAGFTRCTRLHAGHSMDS
jgi:hypothetical protein